MIMALVENSMAPVKEIKNPLRSPFFLDGYIKVPQSVIQACFQVCARLALSDDQGAADVEFTGGEFFQIAAWYHHAACRHPAFVFHGRRAADVDDLGRLGEHDIGAQHGFFFHDNAFHHDASAPDKSTVLDDHGGCL